MLGNMMGLFNNPEMMKQLETVAQTPEFQKMLNNPEMMRQFSNMINKEDLLNNNSDDSDDSDSAETEENTGSKLEIQNNNNKFKSEDRVELFGLKNDKYNGKMATILARITAKIPVALAAPILLFANSPIR